jgi:hypothetical protein
MDSGLLELGRRSTKVRLDQRNLACDTAGTRLGPWLLDAERNGLPMGLGILASQRNHHRVGIFQQANEGQRCGNSIDRYLDRARHRECRGRAQPDAESDGPKRNDSSRKSDRRRGNGSERQSYAQHQSDGDFDEPDCNKPNRKSD